MAYETNGNITTSRIAPSENQIEISEQSEWEDADLTNLEVSEGTVRFQQTFPSAIDNHWDFDDSDTTGTLTDQEGGADGTISGWTYPTNALQGTHAAEHTGSEYTDIPAGVISDPTGDWTYTTTVNLDSLGSDDRILDLRGDVDLILNVGRSGTDTLGVFYNGTDHAVRTIATSTTYFILIEHDSSAGELNVEVNNTVEATVAEAATSGGLSQNRFFGNGNGGNHPSGRQDETTEADTLLTSDEKQTLYDRVK